MQGRASPFVRCCSVACKAISDILKSLLAWQTDEAHLNRIIKALRNWLTSPDLTLRERATRSLIQLLQIYKRQIPSENPTIRNKGHWIGLLVPFCVHTEPAFQYWDLLAAKHEIPSSSNSLGWINQPRSDDDICSPVRETGGEPGNHCRRGIKSGLRSRKRCLQVSPEKQNEDVEADIITVEPYIPELIYPNIPIIDE
ncbi:uncharacterized protein LOC116507598 isoform X2 [Thamnophis elegans]|uniref:uncharacterized protein LOC116507598 isoform X2 n=1 Tax=Thamnophis elegans TaxID=35005 RepID=UPI0013770D3A|nr:uncharacterized protein LOC116507598 isoform X2 [Thamnophis elegans]